VSARAIREMAILIIEKILMMIVMKTFQVEDLKALVNYVIN
jgi:hypothetical protein